jgi:simple sugar transport system ATP-binding protein
VASRGDPGAEVFVADPREKGALTWGSRRLGRGSERSARVSAWCLIARPPLAQNFFLGREPTRSLGPVRWLDRKSMSQAVTEALSTLAVNAPSPEARARRLSGGQRQAIAIARPAAFGSKLVIMDEPTASLGVQETARVGETIRRLRARGVPIVLISHDMQQVLRLSDRVWVLRAGRVAGGGPTSELDGDRLVGLITGAKEGRQP